MKRGDIYLIDFGDGVESKGSEQQGLRPACIVSNDMGNYYSNVLTVVPMTSKMKKANQPTKVFCSGADCGLKQNSELLCEQIRTISKERVRRYVAHLSDSMMVEVDGALKVALGLR